MIVFFYPFGIYYTKVLCRMDKLRYLISRLVTRHHTTCSCALGSEQLFKDECILEKRIL